MFIRLWFVGILLITMLLGVIAEAAEFRVPLTSKPPVIDGRIDPAEWSVGTGFDGFGYDDVLKQHRVQAFVAANETTIYFAVRSQLPEVGSLSAKNDDSLSSMYYSQDNVDVQINPTPDETRYVFYQIFANCLGLTRYRTHIRNAAVEDPGWNGGWKQASSLRDGYWEWECEVPIDSMGMTRKGRKTTDGSWIIDIMRDFKGPSGATTCLSCIGPELYRGFGEGGVHFCTGVPFRFAKDAPSVHYSVGSDPFLSNFTGTLTISNPSPATMELDASIFLDRDRMPEIVEQKKITLAPGQQEQLTLHCPYDDNTTKFEQRILVKSADGKTVYYDRTTRWPRSNEKFQYKGADVQAKVDPIKLDFAYYPYKNKMRIAVDISNLPKDVNLESVTAVVREAASKTAIHSVDISLAGFKDGKQEISTELPPLRGEYELVVKAAGANVPGEVVRTFERNVYEWEGNSLGLSTKVYPPFTPIKVEGKKLSTVLRDHTLNDVGLLDQVTGESAQTGVTKPILAAPMRYTAKVNGKSVRVKASPLKIVSSQENEVRTEASFTAGALNASSVSTWDYDGTVKVELTLLPTDARVDELILEIPFTREGATMIHANADRIRAPVAQRLPEGKGVVWDATRCSYNSYPRTFCPYIYLGDAVRGLCWFTENDKGWGWDSNTPNMEVVRKGKQVILRINLVNKPMVISEPRTITFGMLAAPVKPRLNPSRNPNWWRYRYLRDNYSVLGTDINWFSLGNCGGVYPAGKDLYLWEMLKRGNKERLTSAEIESVVERGSKHYEPYKDQPFGNWLDSFKGSARANLVCRYGTKMVFYYNRASYQACDEFQTFADEWGLSDMRSLEKGKGVSEITIVPCRSYNDYALYWYDKSFDVGGNQGVYWDNLFFVPTSNTEMTDAYKDEDGKIFPAVGVWEMRNLIKRSFVLMNERGMLPITFPHMTSFNPLPLMSFSTVQYDWEWRYSQGDVQDRFSREYILLASNGELAGVWPVPLTDHGALFNDKWTQRTQGAARMVHELESSWFRYTPKAIMDILDKPGLVVYRYWDERPQPVVTGNPDVPTIVYSVFGKEALVGISSYSTKDEQVQLQIDARALGFTDGYVVTDAENEQTGSSGEVASTTFTLKKHDMRLLRIVPKSGN